MKMELGAMIHVTENIKESFEEVAKLGMRTCQVSCTAELMIDRLKPKDISRASEEFGIEISSFFLVFEGQIYNRIEGVSTVGFIPEEYRTRRFKLAEKFSDMIYEIGVKNITSHVGAIPNDEKSPLYLGFVPVMKKFVEYCQRNGQIFCFETGQELPSTLKRLIADIGNNAYVNLDPANLILYGMAHPLDAVEILGEYVRGMHAKDALWPNRDESLGIEVPVGKGEVDFPLLISRLKEKGFQGPITIEREISGEQQKKDILEAKKFLEPYL
ncbi:MAG: xylose isomerase [Candidatus Infernicultor aquiphilus]|nr:MAG: xylose isomerase [Candidatus Atribacteria bacterium CG08_land_8_20_14_0_20_33_29]